MSCAHSFGGTCPHCDLEQARIELDRRRAEIERLQTALKPFADAVHNDGGGMTITPVGHDAYAGAYFAMRGNGLMAAVKLSVCPACDGLGVHKWNCPMY